MKFSDFISNSANSENISKADNSQISESVAQELKNFQLANDSEVSNVSITKNTLKVRYFQRHRKTAQDDKAFKSLADAVFKGKKYTIEYGDFENVAYLGGTKND